MLGATLTLSAERALTLLGMCHNDHAAAILVADSFLGDAMKKHNENSEEYWASVVHALIPDAAKILKGEYDA